MNKRNEKKYWYENSPACLHTINAPQSPNINHWPPQSLITNRIATITGYFPTCAIQIVCNLKTIVFLSPCVLPYSVFNYLTTFESIKIHTTQLDTFIHQTALYRWLQLHYILSGYAALQQKFSYLYTSRVECILIFFFFEALRENERSRRTPQKLYRTRTVVTKNEIRINGGVVCNICTV